MSIPPFLILLLMILKILFKTLTFKIKNFGDNNLSFDGVEHHGKVFCDETEMCKN